MMKRQDELGYTIKGYTRALLKTGACGEPKTPVPWLLKACARGPFI